MSGALCETHHPDGRFRVVATKPLPGERWLELLGGADCRVEVCGGRAAAHPRGDRHGRRRRAATACSPSSPNAGTRSCSKAWRPPADGCSPTTPSATTTSTWPAATALGVAVGNTPGILTETTAELAVALTFAAARRVVEGQRLLAEGRFTGWLPSLLLGKRLWRKTLGVVGAGRIGAAYARMLVEGHKMDLVYLDLACQRGARGVRGRLWRIPRESRRGAGLVPACRHARRVARERRRRQPAPGARRLDEAPDRCRPPRADEGRGDPRQLGSRPAHRRGRPRGTLPPPPVILGRPRRVRARTRALPRPARPAQRGRRPPPRLGHRLDAPRHGDAGRGQRRRRAVGLAGLEWRRRPLPRLRPAARRRRASSMRRPFACPPSPPRGGRATRR